MLLAHEGERPDGQQVRHLDGNPANNQLANLCYGTPRENQADRVRHGTHCRGSQHPQSKLTEEDVAEIRRLGDQRHAALAKRFGVQRNTISRILQRKSWTHV